MILLRDFLKPFKNASDEIEATKCPTLHLVHPWYHELLTHMQSDVRDPRIISKLKAIGIDYWTGTVQHYITTFHDIAVFLHPAMKSLKLHTDREKHNILKNTEDMMKVFVPFTPTMRKTNTNKITQRVDSRAMRFFVDECDNSYDDTETNEIDEYKRLKMKNMDLLEWWESKKEALPGLYSVARFIFSIPASSAASERMFSLAGRIVSVRPNMRSELLDEILFLKSNFDIMVREMPNASETYDEIDNNAEILSDDFDLNVSDSNEQE